MAIIRMSERMFHEDGVSDKFAQLQSLRDEKVRILFNNVWQPVFAGIATLATTVHPLSLSGRVFVGARQFSHV